MKEGWLETNIGSLLTNGCIFIDGDWIESKDQDPDGEVRLIQLADIGDGKFKNKSDRFMTKLKSEELKCTYLKKNDILIARMPDPLGRACLFPFEKEEAFVTVVDVAIIRLNDKFVSTKYVLNMINTPHFRNEIDKLKSGSTRKRISRKNLATLKFPLAPLLEQKAIVAKIEQLFSELDNGISNLKTAQAKLKIYRQAVLKKAFEGELTCEWREKQTNLPTADELLEQIKKEREEHYKQELEEWKQAVKEWEENGQNGKKPSKPKSVKKTSPIPESFLKQLHAIPNSWQWVKTNDIALETILGKMLDKQKNRGYYKPYLRNINVRWGTFDLSDLIEMRFEKGEEKRYGLNKGDLIICEGGEPGRCAIWILENSNIRFQKALHRMRLPLLSVNNKYIYYAIYLSSITGQLEKHFTGTTIKHLTGIGLSNLEIPLCSLEEQNQIVQEIELRLSVCDKIEETIENSLAKSEALRQSILKKAFEGKLLSEQELENIKNHPEYESAEALLKRIKNERDK